jgi:signal transduction histidine kinase
VLCWLYKLYADLSNDKDDDDSWTSTTAETAFEVGMRPDAETLVPWIARSTQTPSAAPRPLPVRAESVRELGLQLCLLAGGAITAVVTLTPALRGAALRPTLHAEISALTAMVALLFAMLAGGRFRRTLMPADLLLSGSLGVIGACNLLFSSIHDATGSYAGYSLWMPLMGRVLGAVLLAAAAFAPARSVRFPGRAVLRTLVGCAAGLAAISVLALLAFDGPLHGGDALPAGGGHARLLSDSASVLVVKGLGAALFALAALGFAVRRRHATDWFGVLVIWGTTLMAFAWLNYLLAPSLYLDWFYTGDGLGLLAYVVLAAGAASELRVAQRRGAALGVLEERGRVARELHDGLAQELVYLVSQTRRLRSEQPGEAVESLVSAAERALHESRLAISSLRASPEEPLIEALERIKRDLGRRLDLDIGLRVAPGLQVSPRECEIILRIVGEALANAAHHGHAGTATVEVQKGDHLRLLIRDDGEGFDAVGNPPHFGSYGLLLMRERAMSAGGQLQVRSAPGSPTEIEMILP